MMFQSQIDNYSSFYVFKLEVLHLNVLKQNPKRKSLIIRKFVPQTLCIGH